MECRICKRKIDGDSQYISGVYYHNRCIENVVLMYELEQKIVAHSEAQLEMQLDKWNKIKKWVEEQIEFLEGVPTFTVALKHNHIGMKGAYKNVLYKIEEIEEE